MAAPDRMECVPICSFLMPSFVSPTATIPSWSAFIIILPVMAEFLPCSLTVQTFDLSDEFGYALIRWTIAAQAATGHIVGWLVFHWVIVSHFESFF